MTFNSFQFISIIITQLFNQLQFTYTSRFQYLNLIVIGGGIVVG
jgi:hypothetical protein